MPQSLGNIPFIATQNISPSVFVRIDPSYPVGYGVSQCTGGGTEIILGISQKGENIPPGLLVALGSTTDPNLAAASGQSLEMFFDSDVCKLTIGAGGCVQGSPLTPDANGAGITATTGQYFGAIPLSGGSAGDLVDVLVRFGKLA